MPAVTTPDRSTLYRRTALRTVALAATFAVNVAAFASCGGGTKETVAPIDTTKPNADQYVNPVINADFPDPSAVKASDGYYYAYATQTTGVRVQVARSSDLVAWTKLGEAMPVKPTWASQSQNFWAPDVHERNGTFVMYYSTQIDAASRIHPDDGFCIGMATATTGAGPFTDVGAPVVCGPGFTTIDPMGFDDPATGTPYLYWGSGGGPIKVQQLAADRRTFAAGSAPVSLLTTSGVSGAYDDGLIEGPWVTFHDPYYYLYFSGNNCCGSGAHYAVMVARSSSPTGPFTKLTASGSAAAQPILRAGDPWLAPGHNSTVTDDAGAEWMVYHAINSANPYLIPGNTNISRRPMLIDPITYANGWPTVGTGVPSSTPRTRPKKNP
ncbi:MAG TPA: glycoside hydrolase family 43 protein [Gemmatimonadaceae bacterium]|nr:glycoside hydrolase family 43 protein [Gemmatimonadaceae bacterium]